VVSRSPAYASVVEFTFNNPPVTQVDPEILHRLVLLEPPLCISPRTVESHLLTFGPAGPPG